MGKGSSSTAGEPLLLVAGPAQLASLGRPRSQPLALTNCSLSPSPLPSRITSQYILSI